MDYLPLFHKLQDRPVLVIGGGEVALRKARLLSDAGARLRVVAPDIRSELQELAGPDGFFLRGYASSDLQGVALVIAATDDEPLNAQISAESQALGIPVNVVDAPALCSVIFPAAKSFDRLLGIMEPLPPLGGTVSTSCSTAQSPLMFGWPSASRSARLEVSTAVVWNWSLRLILGASPSLKFSM